MMARISLTSEERETFRQCLVFSIKEVGAFSASSTINMGAGLAKNLATERLKRLQDRLFPLVPGGTNV